MYDDIPENIREVSDIWDAPSDGGMRYVGMNWGIDWYIKLIRT